MFDNDGTLWCEKPMPIELGFILHRLAEMCEADASLRARQPWKAAYERDYTWLGDVITKHYHGDDSDVKVLVGGILRAFGGMTVETYEEVASQFLGGPHPTLGRTYRECGYVPMIDCCATSRPAGSRRSSLRAVTATSCVQSPRRSTGFRPSA